MLRRSGLTLFILFITFFARGQDSIRREFAAGFGYGGILPHSEEVRHLARSHPWQLNAEYRVITEKGAGRKIPSYGAGIHFIDYQSEVLGSTLTLFGFAEPAFFGPVAFRIGCGIGWNSNSYNARSNPANIMLGSALSGLMQARLSASWRIHPKIRLNYGIGLTHFSNGAWSHPNKGINCYYLFSNVGFTGKKFRDLCPLRKAGNQKTITGTQVWLPPDPSRSASLSPEKSISSGRYRAGSSGQSAKSRTCQPASI